jgi:hypothetical protein
MLLRMWRVRMRIVRIHERVTRKRRNKVTRGRRRRIRLS